MTWKPVRPIKEKIEAVDIERKHGELVIIKIPLNKNPNLQWEYEFENPKALKGPIYSQKVLGDAIIVKANRDRPVDAVKQIYEYIESTNESYQEYLEDGEKEFIDVDEEELEEVTEEIRKI